MSESEIASLFRLLSDDMLLHDPSRGTCCRNRCSGCAYLDPTSGDFACDEYTAAGSEADDPRPGGWPSSQTSVFAHTLVYDFSPIGMKDSSYGKQHVEHSRQGNKNLKSADLLPLSF